MSADAEIGETLVPDETDTVVRPTIDPNASTVYNLRRQHVELLKAWPSLEDAAREPSAEAFRQKAAAMGTDMEDVTDRDAAQGMIDYWTATIAALPGHQGFPKLVMLAPFDEANRKKLKEHVASPFVGLNAFVASDSDRFFGRLEASEKLYGQVQVEPLVVVAGASGCGKSSLVFAGLGPKLEADGQWHVLPALTPGNDPVAALLQPFWPAEAEADWFDGERKALADNPRRLAELAAALSPKPVFLIVDQAEELFTFELDAAVRQIFFRALDGLLRSDLGHRVVLTIRSDFVNQLLAQSPLMDGRDAGKLVFPVEALTSRELQDAISGPSQRIGLKIDPRVVEDLVREVVGEPAALPLLQFTLTRLWSKAGDDRITWEDYQEVGRPADALRQAAEEVWTQLRLEENQEAARLIFLQLIRPAGGAESVRGGRVRRETLRKLKAADRIDRTLDKLVAAGLLRRTAGSEADDDRFEIAHETLIRQWPRLVGWLEQRSRENQENEQLMASAELWRNSGERGYLLDGDALRKASVSATTDPHLADYVAASLRWRYIRQRRFIVTGVLLVLILISLFVVLYFQRGYAVSAEAAANEEKARANSEARILGDTTRATASTEARVSIAEQTLVRLIAAHPDLRPDIPSPLLTRLSAESLVPTAGWLAGAKGYDPTFLGVNLPLPRSKAPVVTLDYVNFTVGYDPVLKTPRYAISNYDRIAEPQPSRVRTGFARDPRIAAASQPDAFAGLSPDLARAPLVSWREIGWEGAMPGPVPRNDLVTASVVQPWSFNQGLWTGLRRTAFSTKADRVVFITGPLLKGAVPGSPASPPTHFWKMAISRATPEAPLEAEAYLVPVTERKATGSMRAYRIGLPALSRLTGLSFTLPLRSAAPAPPPPPVPAPRVATVYLQFAQMSRAQANAISEALAEQGFVVPGEEQVSVKGLHEVRYYAAQDAPAALRLADATTAVLAAQGFGTVPVRARLLSLKGPLPKPGVLELWVTIPSPAR